MTGTVRFRSVLLKSILVVALLLPLLVPLFRQYWFGNHEGYAYAYRVIEVRRCWDDGMFSARWFPDPNYGQGYPFLCFYAPLTFVLAGLITLTGTGVLLSLKLTVALAAALGAVGAYRLVRRASSAEAAMVGAALFTYAPYHVSDLYTRGDLAEFMAMGLLPWCIDGVLALRDVPSLRRALTLGIVGAATILSHNLLGLFAGGAMAVTAIVATLTSPRWRRTAAHAALGGAVALLLSLFFWLPAMLERKWVNIERMVQGAFRIAANFAPVSNLLGLGEVPGTGFIRPVAIGLPWIALLLALVAIVGMRRLSREARPLGIVAAALFVGGAVLSTSVSKPIYEMLPLLRFTQFPWRFVALSTLGASVLAALGFEILSAKAPPRFRMGAVAIASVVAIASAWEGIAPLKGLPPFPEVLEIKAIRVQRGFEYMPIWLTTGKLRKLTASEDPVQVDGDATFRDVVRRVARYEFRVEAREPATIGLIDLYYPAWMATLDGRKLPLRPRAETGNIEFAVPAGTWDVRVWFGRTPLRAVTDLLSAVTAAMVAVALLAPRGSPSR